MKTSSPASPTTYRPQAEDTSVETDRFEFELLRKRTAAERALMSAAIALASELNRAFSQAQLP